MSTSPLTLHAAPAAGFDEPFEMLAACHERVQRSLALLMRLAAHLQQQGADEAARQAAADVLRYFDRAAPAHHEDEERHVLPALRATGVAADSALADRLAQDHQRMAAAWAQLRPALVALAEGAQLGSTRAAGGDFERWRAFAALYEGHIEAEDGVAFRIAAERLDAAARRAMGEEMARRRGVALGAGPTDLAHPR